MPEIRTRRCRSADLKPGDRVVFGGLSDVVTRKPVQFLGSPVLRIYVCRGNHEIWWECGKDSEQDVEVTNGGGG